jgi:hypothetical protein
MYGCNLILFALMNCKPGQVGASMYSHSLKGRRGLLAEDLWILQSKSPGMKPGLRSTLDDFLRLIGALALSGPFMSHRINALLLLSNR